jgi:hypothetical protein
MRKFEGCRISTNALVIDQIGRDEEGKSIEVLIGAGHAGVGHSPHPR